MKKSEQIENLKKYIKLKQEMYNETLASFAELYEEAQTEIERLNVIIDYLETKTGAEID